MIVTIQRHWHIKVKLIHNNNRASISGCLYKMNVTSSFYRHNSSPITMLASYPQMILQTLQMLIAKIIELTSHVQQLAPPQKTQLINIHDQSERAERRQTKQRQTLPKSALSVNISTLRVDFESMLSRLTQFKTSSSFDKKMLESSPSGCNNSFEFQELQINMIKVEQDLKKQIGVLKQRMTMMEEDIGQILLFYKDLIFDK